MNSLESRLENARLASAIDDSCSLIAKLDWDSAYTISLDGTIQFGLGYDFFGLESLRREAVGPNGNYLMWPNGVSCPGGRKWSLYRDSDGACAFEKFASREECEQAAERWCSDVLSV